jgi:hypothetical protein
VQRDWEAQFREGAKPPGKIEHDRCDNAISAIRNAIRASDKLRADGVSIFAQGSFRNNTTVRKDREVDIGTLCTDSFSHDPLPKGRTREKFGFSDANYHYGQYKNEIGVDHILAVWSCGRIGRTYLSSTIDYVPIQPSKYPIA